MFSLQWQSKAIDDGAEDFQQLGHPVVPLCLVDKAVEYVVDLLPKKSSKIFYIFVLYIVGKKV